MLDNLRRTLSAPAMFLTLLLAWVLPPVSPWVWARFILATIAIPPLIPFLAGLNPRVGGISKRSHFRSVLTDLALGLSQIGLTVTFLAYQAWLMSDAILRTLTRLFITRKNLLEWVTAAQAKYDVDFQLIAIFRRMAGGILLTIGTAVALAFATASCLCRCCAFPASLGRRACHRALDQPAAHSLHGLSCHTANTSALRAHRGALGAFSKHSSPPEEHFLPPDNFQEDPNPVVAHRTSPTNIGLYLLSAIAARDFGWLGTQDAMERLEATLATIGKLEKFRGHLFNWYDTRDLRPLDPQYISSVDSGNLAGHLLAVASGCRELSQGHRRWARPCLRESKIRSCYLREALAKLHRYAAASTP